MKTKKCAILQSNYIPWKGYFDLINSVDEFIFYDCVQYTQNDWRNRNKVKTATGAQWITIPVSRPSLASTIVDATTANQTWRAKHWSSISQNYRGSKYFDDYADTFKTLYEGTENSLSEINQLFIRCICDVLGIETEIVESSKYELSGDRNQRVSNQETLPGSVQEILPKSRD